MSPVAPWRVVASALLATSCVVVLDLDVDGFHAQGELLPDGGRAPVTPSDGGGDTLLPDGGVAPTCNADTAVDGDNCGVCGHACLGGKCEKGKCQPRVLTSFPASTDEAGMANDANYVYVALRTSVDGGPVGVIRRIDKKTGATMDLTAQSGTLRTGIDVMGGQVFFFSGPAGRFDLKTVGTDGTGVKSLVPATTVGSAGPLSASDNQVLWLDSKSPSRVGICRLGAFAGGIACNTIGTVVNVPSFPWALQVRRDRFCTTSVITETKGSVLCCALPTCASIAPIAEAEESPLSLAFDDTAVFWLALGEIPAVRRCSLPTCAQPTTLATSLILPMHLAIDDTHVYWTESGGLGRPNQGSLQRCPKAGCGPESPVVAGGLTEPDSLTLGAEAAYWIDKTDGVRVMLLAK